MILKNLKCVFILVALFCCTPVFAIPIVAQFFGIWLNHGQTWQQKFRTDTPFNKLNRLYIAFGKIVQTTNGHFTIAFDGPVDHAQALIARMKTQNPTADIFLTVGGDDGGQSYGGAAHDPNFAPNVLQFLNEYGFNGFDIDWESNFNKNDLSLLVENLYATLHANHKKVTFDVQPIPDPAFDMSVLKNNLDQINIMSYGQNSLYVDWYTSKGFPENKMIGGVETEVGYDGGPDTLGPSGTIAQKSHYALQNGLAGMMAWRLDNDYATTDPNVPTYQGATQLWNSMMTTQHALVGSAFSHKFIRRHLH